MREELRTGIDYLEAVTVLLQRIRSAHPTSGLYEAADLQWWWRQPRATDEIPQLFWFDDQGLPAAAAIATAWKKDPALDCLVLPDASDEWRVHVFERGLAHTEEQGLGDLGFEVADDDQPLLDAAARAGLSVGSEPALVEAWLDAETRPAVSELADGYRLVTRAEVHDRPHHMIERNGAAVEERLRQTSLYRPDLDLVVLDHAGEPAGYGLFWHDPTTSTGIVEPMRTHDDHQRRGLARHVLTAGIDRLAAAGAERIKICFESDNPPAAHLYLDVGFRPIRQTVFVTRNAESSAS